jgi:hypothetical protein
MWWSGTYTAGGNGRDCSRAGRCCGGSRLGSWSRRGNCCTSKEDCKLNERHCGAWLLCWRKYWVFSRVCAVFACQNPAKIASFQSSYRPHKPRSRHMWYNQSTNKSIHPFELAEREKFSISWSCRILQMVRCTGLCSFKSYPGFSRTTECGEETYCKLTLV